MVPAHHSISQLSGRRFRGWDGGVSRRPPRRVEPRRSGRRSRIDTPIVGYGLPQRNPPYTSSLGTRQQEVGKLVDSASRSRLHSPGVIGLATVLLLALLSSVPAAGAAAAPGGPRVLYVGAYRGINTPESSTFTSIQAAVDASRPGDWT